MHNWNDKEVDWKGISDAAQFIENYCTKWGRLGGPSKEKYGTVRFYASFGHLSLHTLFYPGYHYNQFPAWLWNADIDYIGPVLDKLFGRVFISWQKFIYNRAYWKALYKWPHLRAEILVCSDYHEFIKGVTRVKGNETHILGWNGEIISTWVRLE